MNNKLKRQEVRGSMNRKFKNLVKELNSENRSAFDKIKNRLSGSIMHRSLYKENINEVLNMLIEGQKRNETYQEVIGENLDEFCEEIIESSYKPNLFDKVFRISYLFSIAISIGPVLSVLLEALIYKENLILKAFSGELSEVNIVHFVLWAITGVIFFLSQDLVVRTSLKKTSIHSLAIGVLLIAVYLQKSTEKINFVYMVNVNYILLTLVIVSIIVSYQIYNLNIIKKFRKN